MWRWLCSLAFSLWVWGLIIMRIIFSLDNSASHYPSMFLYACSEGFFKLMNEERLQLWSMCVYLGVRVLRVQDGRSCVPLWHPPKSLIYCLSVLCSGLQDTHTHTAPNTLTHTLYFSPSGFTLTPQLGFTQWENTGGGQRSPLLYKTDAQSKYYNACLVELRWSSWV